MTGLFINKKKKRKEKKRLLYSKPLTTLNSFTSDPLLSVRIHQNRSSFDQVN